MKSQSHGISIGIERVDDHFFLTFRAVGRLTHGDYQIITPLLDRALEGVREPRILALFDATELEGWELRAAWDDFKIGVRHGNQFEKVAIVGSQKWQEWAAKVGGWFIAGEARHFDDLAEARAWLAQTGN